MRHFAWKSVLVTFAVSFVLGAAFGRWEYARYAENRWKNPAARQEWILKKMDARLGLSHVQEEKVAAILREFSPQWEAVRKEMWPKFFALRQNIRQRIRPLLTPPQQEKYDAMEAEWEERKGKFSSGADAGKS